MVEYSYDARGRQTQVKFQDNSQSITHSYNAIGQITATATKMPAAGISSSESALSYQYDQVGNRTRITHPGGLAFNYAYDQSSRMTLVERGSTI